MLTMYNTAREIDRDGNGIAILPIGALEQHGSHLPVGTDIIIAEAFSRRMARRLKAYLLPPLAITCSIEHRKSKSTVYLSFRTLAQVIEDIADSLRQSGFKQLLLINAHGGNWVVKPIVRELNRRYADFEVIILSTWMAASRQDEVMEQVPNDLHAGEKETSLMMHLAPDQVRPIEPGNGQGPSYPQDFMDYFDATELTADGSWGYPERATPEKGEKMLQILEEFALEYLEAIEKKKRSLAASRNPSNV